MTSRWDPTEVVDALEAEDDRLETILDGLDVNGWMSPSLAAGWTIADVMVHLAQTDEAVANLLANPPERAEWRTGPLTVDEMVEAMVQEQRAAPSEVFERWRRARRAAVVALRSADPSTRVPWAAAPLKPATLATTRLAEHWAHALDITVPLGIELPDTDRLRHIARLGHRTLPYAFGLEGLTEQPIRCELTAPSGDTWNFGPEDAPTTIVGPGGDFCRVGARRLAPEESRLVASGPHGATALRVLRNYAF